MIIKKRFIIILTTLTLVLGIVLLAYNQFLYQKQIMIQQEEILTLAKHQAILMKNEITLATEIQTIASKSAILLTSPTPTPTLIVKSKLTK